LQKSVSEPILALEQTAKVISEQRDYSVRAEKYGSDEVGALTDAFNQMLAQIQSQNREILLFNQNLEQKVKDRTLDLQQQKDFVETVINSSVDLIAVFDKNLNYLILNKRADEYYILKREQVIGKNILDVYPHVIESGMFRDLKKALTGEYIHNSKYRSSVAKKYFDNYYIPLKDVSGKVYGVMAIAHDITQIMEATEKLETLNAELLKSNRDLEQFAYVASHDLQEPLRKIQTFTDLMSESFQDKEKLKKYHDKINQSASRMQGLIQDVLNFSRISKAEEAFEETDLDRILKTIETDFELIIREKGAIINHSTLPTIRGIPMQLSQLFSNIIGNALKYNEQKPVIHISSRRLTAEEVKNYSRLNGHSSYFELKFSDNGIGFEPQFKEQIFNVFQRLHGRQEYSGTGIGLALCKKIVENHQGIIYANAQPGQGAVFTVVLPG
jgi:two-component system CheB/CheR fusion protein